MGGGTLDVRRVLDGARIVVLGGTGFLGKLFWSMLLDRYPNVGRIYLVVRPKDAGPGTPEARFSGEIATSESLEPLRRAHGDGYAAFLRDKIVPVDGDMGRPLCGLTESFVAELRGTIDAVINVAGVVDFNPALDDALDANAFGAQNVVGLSRALGDVAVLHTSTCYVAGTRDGPILEEDPRVVPFPRAGELDVAAWDPEREIAECLDLVAQAKHRSDDAFRQSELAARARANLVARGEPSRGEVFDRELASVKRAFVRERLVEAGLDRATHWGWPNIYTYTKAIGEQVVAASGLPFTIVRPACCESTISFPFPAFNEGINTSAPLIYLIMKGEPQILGAHVPLDLIPSDHVVAGMIMALAELLEGTAKPVYQLAASDLNPCSMQRFGELVSLYKRAHYRRKGSGRLLFDALQARYEPSFVDRATFERTGAPARAAVTGRIASLVKAAVPALAAAVKPLERMARRDAKIAEIQRLFEPFTSKRVGPFDCSSTRAAFARLSDEDKRKLPWAPEQIDWADWMLNVHMPAMEKRIIPEMDRKLRKEVKPLRAHSTLVSMIDEMAEVHGAAPAVARITDVGPTRTSFADVKRGAEAFAARLARSGIRHGDRVVISGANDPDWAVAFFGIVRAGATAVPVDPVLDHAAWRNILRESGARAVVWDDAVKARSSLSASGLELQSFDVRAAVHPSFDGAPPDVRVDPHDVASVLFTSGTTGRPKGVMLTHANFTSLVAALAPLFPLRPGDTVLSVLPLHHTFEFTCGLLLPLSRGARIVYVGELTGDRVVRGLQASRAVAMVGVPALWQLLERRIVQQVDARGPIARAAFDAALEVNRWLASNVGVDAGRILFGEVHEQLGGNIRWLVSGGAALPRETQERFAGMGLRLMQGYGLTEAAPVLAVSGPGRRIRRGVGKPIPGVELRIDAPDERGVGEIVARGSNVMLGYTDPEATAAAIDRDGWLHTGDLGRMSADGLQIVGRIKDVVISPTGENVYPDDVEARLGVVPHVAELVVIGVEADGAERLACLAVPAADETVERAERLERARSALRRAIEDLPFGQRPAIVHLADSPLPRTGTRKVKRDEVRAVLRRAMAGTVRATGPAEGGAVRAAIAAVARKSADAIDGEASLQGSLGLDSLAMTEILETLEARFGPIDAERLNVCVTVADVESLVKGLDEKGTTAPRPSIDASASDALRLLPDPARAAGRALVGKIQDIFYGEVMKPRVLGRVHIPHNRNVIVVANHASHLDMGLVRHALGSYGRDIVSLAAQDYFFQDGIKRFFFENMTNLKPFDRRASVRQALRQAGEVIEQGRTVLIFPEGTRSPTGEMRDFKPLVGHLALSYGVDLLPVHLGGTFTALPKGAAVPVSRDVVARIGPVLCVSDLHRLTEGMTFAQASREVSRLAQVAVEALRDGRVLDLAGASRGAPIAAARENPMATLFSELESKFRAGEVERSVSYYVTLGNDDLAKWTVRVDARECDVRPGKPAGGQADCVLKTTPELFTRIVRESYVPSPADFLSGAFKSNDIGLLMTFQKVFQLDQAS